MAVLLGEWGFLDNLEDTSGWEHPAQFRDNDTPAAFTGYVPGPLTNTRAAKLTGPNDSFSLGRTGLEPATGGLTVLCWFKVDSAATFEGTVGLLSKARAGSSSRFRVGYQVADASNVHIDFAVRWKDDLQFGVLNGSPISKGVWHELMVADHESYWGVWVDGTQLAYGTRSGLPADPAPWEDYPWLIGQNTVVGDQGGSQWLSISAVRMFSGTDFPPTTPRTKWANTLRVTTDPWSFYDFAEGTGNADSITGQGVAATPSTGASWGGVHKAVGQFNNCYPHWVDFGNSYERLREWTLVFDLKVNAIPDGAGEGTWDVLAVKSTIDRTDTLRGMYLQWTTDGKPTMYFGSEFLKSSVALTPGVQHQLIYLSTGAVMQIWLDGVKVAESSAVIVDMLTGDDQMKLFEANSINGELNALRAYRHGLTPAQIATIPTPEYLIPTGPRRTIAEENALTGTARVTWDLSAGEWGGISTLQGFADGMSFDVTETCQFKIAQSDSAGWTADVYRLGWYGGNGARFYGTLTPTAPQLTASQAQPAPTDVDPITTRPSVDCDNWAVTLEWDVPAEVPSGIFLLKLNRTGGGSSHVLFVVRDDARQADLMLMPADSTWQAYNAFGGVGPTQADLLSGNSLYYGSDVNQYASDCARFVSWNRPIVNRAACNSGQAYGAVEWSTFFTGEFGMVKFLERNGFDVKYYSCLDASGDPTGTLLASVKAAMYVGHNEYWSNHMRSGWEAFKASGGSVFACAGNDVFWRTVGDTPDSKGRPRRIECYKSTINGRATGASGQWTGTWRDKDGAGIGGDNPENLFIPSIFMINGPDLRAIVVPTEGDYHLSPIWRHTTVADMTSGSWTSPSQIGGFEWNVWGPAGVSGPGAVFLAEPHLQAHYASHVEYNINSGILLTDAGDVYDQAGTAQHRLALVPSGDLGGITFSTATVNWPFGLDDQNTYHGVGGSNESVVLQQATINLLTDMGCPPSTLMVGLTAPEPHPWFGSAPAASSGLQEWDGESWSDLSLEEWDGTEWVPISIIG